MKGTIRIQVIRVVDMCIISQITYGLRIGLVNEGVMIRKYLLFFVTRQLSAL